MRPLYKISSVNIDSEQTIAISLDDEKIDVIDLSVSLGSVHAGFKDKMSRAVTSDIDKTVNNTPRSASPERLSDISIIKTAQMMADSKNYFATPMTRTASETSSVGTLQAGGSEDEISPDEIPEPQSDYWRKAFAGAPTSLDLPTDHPRSAEASFAGAESRLDLETPLMQLLTSLGQDHGSDLSTLMLVAWSIVLSRLSSQDDIVIGMGGADEKGPTFDALPIRIDLSGEPNTYQLLERVRDARMVSDAHRPSLKDAGGGITRWHKNDLPPFQVAFYCGDLVQEQTDNVSVRSDLELHLLQDTEDAVVSIRYATALFNKDTIERHLGYLNAALMNLVANASHPVVSLDIISRAERKLVLEKWNGTAAHFPADCCVHQLFVDYAEKTPEAIAIVHNDKVLTYLELNALSDRLAYKLVEAGVKHGDFVAILLQRSIELVAAQLAVLKVGAAYVPIDSKAPVDRQAFIVRDSSAVLLITDADTEIPSALALPLFRFDSTTLRSTDVIASNIDLAGSSMDTAYVMYTSGSTGLPKGVMVSHRGIARLIINNGYASIGSNDRIIFGANPAFDATTFEVWAPLLHGVRMVIVDFDTYTDPHRLADVLHQHKITILFLTPVLLNQYVSTIGSSLAKLRYLISGGEQGSLESYSALLDLGGPVRIINAYGPTEATMIATTFEAYGGTTDGLERLPIGRPISNTQAYVLDKRGKPVPLGAVGELYIGGPGVANGYLNRPDLTAERFLPDPFSKKSGDRMYKSGDLVRHLPDGNLVYMGRNDDQ
ncbi:hypothetical protein BGX28_007411, partial [Mortierella sp. GBA30]